MRIGCKQCGTYDKHPPCPKCGVPIHIGSDYRCNHERVAPSKGFEPFFHVGFGKMITGVGDINAASRPRWEDDHLVQTVVRDRPAGYDADLNARRESRREQAMKGRR